MGDRTCATCRHWTDITSQYDGWAHPRFKHEEEGETKYEPMQGRWGWCGKVDKLDPETRECRFYVTDASGYAANLHTRETFGCNQWEGDADG
jgi:hypothetical protein